MSADGKLLLLTGAAKPVSLGLARRRRDVAKARPLKAACAASGSPASIERFAKVAVFCNRERIGPLFFFLRGRKKKSAPGWRRKKGPWCRLPGPVLLSKGSGTKQLRCQSGASQTHCCSLSAAALAHQVRCASLQTQNNRQSMAIVVLCRSAAYLVQKGCAIFCFRCRSMVQ